MSSPFLGEVRMWGCNFAPKGWAFCQGQLLSIQQNTALFSLFGTFYGGNGTSTFGLPNLQGRTPIHQGQGLGLSPYVIGEVGGTPMVTLQTTEMPSHNHTLQADEEPAVDFDPTNDLVAGIATANANLYGPLPGSKNQFLAPQAVGLTGNNLPHNNMAPYLVLNFTVALQGVFPTRN